MANLIDHKKWAITGGTRKESTFTLTNGSMKQSIAVPGDETKYKLEFNCLEIVNPKSYFLFKVVTLGGKHTYLVPVNFLGPNSIEIEFVTDIRTMDIALIGSLTVADINFCENGTLTQSQKDSISKVESESEKWDRIVDVTNEQGNLIASRLEGSINNALNSIFGGNGTMEIIDGTIMFRDGATDAASTMAMRINFAGLAIADSKKPDGTWDWKTFGTGQGFTADYMTTGTLSAITIDGVTITATDIVGGKITGAVIDGGTTKEGVIKGYKIIGSEVIGGDSNGVHTLIAPGAPFKIKRGSNGIVAELWAHEVGGGSYLRLYGLEDLEGSEPKIELRSGGTFSSLNANKTSLDINVTAYAGQKASGRMNINVDKEFMVNKDGKMWIGVAENNVCYFGQSGCQTYIDGDVYLENPKSLSLSELEVRNLELEYENRQLGLKQSDMEVSLMERGIL